jgi:hypothetical protein
MTLPAAAACVFPEAVYFDLFREQQNQAQERGQECQNQHPVNHAQPDFRGVEPRMISAAFVSHDELCLRHTPPFRA